MRLVAAKVRTAEQRIASIARGQHGNVTHVQLRRAGLSRHEIAHRLAVGALLRIYRGVYRVGHAAPSVEADYMGAVLACGDGAALCELAAAHLLGIVIGKAPAAEVVTRGERRVAGLRTRRSRGLGRSDVTRWRGIPVTTPARTLVDLAAHMSLDELAEACHLAGVRHHTTPRQVKAVLARRTNAPGAAKFRPIFVGDAPAILSEMERRALAALARAGSPRPEVNRRKGAHYVDLRWPGLTVELDSYRFHHSRHAWEGDHRRRRAARARGDEFRSYAWDDVVEERAMVEEIRRLLGR
jgi:hypothetical protein